MSARCKSCNAEIIWGRTRNGKPIPLDAEPEKRAVGMLLGSLVAPDSVEGAITVIIDTYTPHWATCEFADQHRTRKEGD